MSLTGQPGFARLGFGVTGPHAGLGQTRRQTARLVGEAVSLGATFFDTGPAYGRGEAEKRLGQALASVPRDRVFVSTKAGIHTDRKRDFSPGAVEMSLKGSLRRLHLDHVDVLWLHGPAPEEISERLLAHLEAFRERGLFRYLGVCGRGPELDAAIAAPGIDALMAPVHAGLHDSQTARLQAAHDKGLAIIGIETMAGLTRAPLVPRNTGEAWYAARRLKQAVLRQTPKDPPTARPVQTATQALGWALAQPWCDAAVTLTTRAAHLRANAAAAGLAGKALKT
ncbi:aldo/keto reductase [Maricaulis sp. CAU 1757]